MYRHAQMSAEMSDWSPHLNYNHNPPYHAYAYGLMCPPGSTEQAHGNPSGWRESEDDHRINHNNHMNNDAGMTQAYYAANMPQTQSESPPDSPEQHDPCRYPGSEVVYLDDSQAGCLVLAGAQQASEDTGVKEARRTGSDSTSDTESRISADSWSTSSSRDTSLPQNDPATWAKNGLNGEASNGSPDPTEAGATSHVAKPMTKELTGKEATNHGAGPGFELEPEMSGTALPKSKARTAFSEGQMNVLVQRFSVHRYLPPAEMKNLAEMLGMTYKQVKTWFQNRRMKLRRHQKDTSWVSERYTASKCSPTPMCGPVFNIPSHAPPFQGEARPELKEHFNQHMMRKTAPPNLAFYLAAMGSANGAAGYPTWPPGPAQTPGPNRPQAASWPVPPGIGHYGYNPGAFSPTGVYANDDGYEFKVEEPVDCRSPVNTATVPTAGQ